MRPWGLCICRPLHLFPLNLILVEVALFAHVRQNFMPAAREQGRCSLNWQLPAPVFLGGC